MKCAITRKNRERRTGHKSAMPVKHVFGDDYAYCTPVERELIKKISKKKMRRQHKMTHQAINRELNNDWTWQDEERELELESAWYSDEPMMVPYTMEELGYPDWFDDGYDPFPMADWEMEENRVL